jgi:hypothetical protein
MEEKSELMGNVHMNSKVERIEGLGRKCECNKCGKNYQKL